MELCLSVMLQRKKCMTSRRQDYKQAMGRSEFLSVLINHLLCGFCILISYDMVDHILRCFKNKKLRGKF